MEKLELLAQRIDSLILELRRLRDDNSKLGNEIKELRDELELSKMEKEDLQKQINIGEAARAEACSQVENLIGRIQAVFQESAEIQSQAQMPSPDTQF